MDICCDSGSWLIARDYWYERNSFREEREIYKMLTSSGYIGRIQMDPNPWNSSAFQTQICCIIIAPTFICAAIYLTLKHVALALNPGLSRIHPRWYPRIFLPADLSCLIIQAIGGGVAAAAKRNQPDLARNGKRTIIAGVVLQVIVLLAFGAMGTDYYLRVKKYLHSSEAAPESLRVWQDKKFRMFGFAVSGAYFAILTRCIYRLVQNPHLSYLLTSADARDHRIAEMAGGWGNHIMQDEPSFLVLDSSLVLVTGFLLTAFHPGIFFPQMAVTMQRTKKTTRKKMMTRKKRRIAMTMEKPIDWSNPNIDRKHYQDTLNLDLSESTRSDLISSQYLAP